MSSWAFHFWMIIDEPFKLGLRYLIMLVYLIDGLDGIGQH